MLGWSVTITTTTPEECTSGPYSADFGSWISSMGGTDWLDQLVSEGKAVFFGGNGYPDIYTARADVLQAVLCTETPLDELYSTLYVKTHWPHELDRELLARQPADRILTIVLWDQS